MRRQPMSSGATSGNVASLHPGVKEQLEKLLAINPVEIAFVYRREDGGWSFGGSDRIGEEIDLLATLGAVEVLREFLLQRYLDHAQEGGVDP